MAYFRNRMETHIIVNPSDSIQHYMHCTNFNDIRLESVWKRYSEMKDKNGDFIQPQVVPELEELCIPYKLFYSMGVYQWFRYSFPNCKLVFWEDIM